MADEQEILADVRQGVLQLVRLLRAITRYLNGRSRSGVRAQAMEPFARQFDQRLPGLRDEITRNDHLDDAQLADRLQNRFGPQWANRAGQVVGSIPANHPVYANSAVREARQAYADHQQAQVRSRLGQGLMDAKARLAAAPPSAAAPPVTPQPVTRPNGSTDLSAAFRQRPAQATPAQPTPAQPTPAQPTPAQPTPAQPTPAQPTPGQAGPGQAGPGQGPGTRATFTSDKAGAALVDASLLGNGGRVTVREDPACTQARVTVWTPEQSGPTADAVRNAGLRDTPDGRLEASVQGQGVTAGSVSFYGNGFQVNNVHGSVNGSVVQVGAVYGQVISGDMVFMNGGRMTNGNVHVMQSPPPIEVEVVVPPGSSARARTDSAGIDVAVSGDARVRSGSGDVAVNGARSAVVDTGSGGVELNGTRGDAKVTTGSGGVEVNGAHLADISTGSGAVDIKGAGESQVRTGSGAVTVDGSRVADLRTGSGDITVRGSATERTEAHTGSGKVRLQDFGGVGSVDTGSGNIRVDATRGGDIRARSFTGSVTVTADGPQTAANLTGSAISDFGQVRTPPGSNVDAPVRTGNASSGARDFKSGGWTGPQQHSDRTR